MSCQILLQAAPSDWVLFWGHFHPLIVHLPIGFLLIAGLLEIDRLTRRNTVSQHTITLILFWSAVSATLACVFGYMLSLGGGYEPETLDTHKWQGIGVAVFAWIAWAVKAEHSARIVPAAKVAYLPALGVSLILLLAAGHQGGNLTHGSDYLTQYVPGPIRSLAGLPPKITDVKSEPITDVNKAMVYQQIVNPILQTRCVQCHNAEKSKARLRLDSPDMIQKGYDEGPVFVSGKAMTSALIKVCLLPDEDDHHMPPKGKPQLTEGQIALLTWWIDQGAPFDKRVADLTVTDAIRPVLASLTGDTDSKSAPSVLATTARTDGSPAPESPVLTMALPAVAPSVINDLKKAGLLVVPLSNGKNQLEISAVNNRMFNDDQSALLTKASSQIVWLKLGNTAISDASSVRLGQLKNLQKLHLEHTKLTDRGLKPLKNLANLEYLNLYGTAVTDAGIAELASLKNLKTLYLWQTNVTEQGAAQLQNALPGLQINRGIDDREQVRPSSENGFVSEATKGN